LKKLTTILYLTFAVSLLAVSCYVPRMNAQQAGAENPEQEFLDAIKKGNSPSVEVLLEHCCCRSRRDRMFIETRPTIGMKLRRSETFQGVAFSHAPPELKTSSR